MSQPSPPPQDAWTILALLDWTTRFFAGKGIHTARLDAELLLAHALGCRRIELYARYDRVPRGEPLDRFRQLVRQRGARVPAKYLVGHAEFYSRAFAVGPGVLIPRPETELLVERALEALPEDRDLRVADLGTGCGAIAIAVAALRPRVRVEATDLSAEALAVAKANAERHEVADRVAFRQGDWFEALGDGEPFDAILSNPPYVAAADLDAAMPEVRDHEPRLALDGGPDGLNALRAIIGQAPAWLVPGGWLLVEIGAGQSPAVRQLAEAAGRYAAIDVTSDFQDVERIVAVRKAT